MHPYELESRDPHSHEVLVVIDTPAGSRNKYKFDEAAGLFRVSRVLPLGMAFPHDFGSIPGTRAEDGDPLDVMVLGLAPAFPGCLVTVHLLGVLQAVQTEHRKRVRNDRLIAVASTPVNPPSLRDLDSVGREHLHHIEQFFVSYNRAQGRDFRFTARSGPRAAEASLERAVRRFARSRVR